MSKRKPEGNKRPANPKSVPTVQSTVQKVEDVLTARHSYPWWVFPALIVLSFVLYGNTLEHQWALDDASAITDNRLVKQGSSAWVELLTTEYRYGYWNSPGNLYRPVTLLYFNVLWQISPESPKLFHLMQILLYSLLGFMIFRLVRRLWFLESWWAALLIAVMFMIHPLHTEVVANVKSADELFSLLFSVMAFHYLVYWIDEKNPMVLGGALLSYLVAMFSKEGAITFLVLFPVALWIFRPNAGNARWTGSALMVVPALIFLLCRSIFLGDQLSVGNTYSPLDTTLAATHNYGEQLGTALLYAARYLWVTFFPWPLVSDLGYQQFPVVGVGNWKSILALVLLSGAFGVSIYGLLKKKSPAAFGVFIFLICFSLVSNLVMKIGTAYGERLLFAPSLGWAIAIGSLLYAASRHTKLRVASMVLTGIIAITYCYLTIQRNPAWYDSFTLYQADIRQAPNCIKLRYHYGLELAKKGKDATDSLERREWLQKGLVEYKRVLAQYPTYFDAWAEKGLAEWRLGARDSALASYQKSLEHNPNQARVWSNMGMIYYELQNWPKMKEVYTKSVQLDPNFTDGRRNLGALYAMQSIPDSALIHFEYILQNLDPDNVTILDYASQMYALKFKNSNNPQDQQKSKNYQERARMLQSSSR